MQEAAAFYRIMFYCDLLLCYSRHNCIGAGSLYKQTTFHYKHSRSIVWESSYCKRIAYAIMLQVHCTGHHFIMQVDFLE